MTSVLNFILVALPLGMTLLYGAVGEILVEKVGHLNLGIPGIMCMGGAGGCVALQMMYDSGLPPVLVVVIAILAAFATGMLMGLIYAFLTVSLRANQNVTGLVMTIFGSALAAYITRFVDWVRCRYALPYFQYPFSNEDGAWSKMGCMVYLAVFIAIALSFVLSRTRIGLNIRAIGENPATADAAGINVTRYKYLATCVGCGISALGGLFYIMVCSGSQDAYKSIEPFGWLAVALVIFTLWRPVLTILGAVIFGALYIFGSYVPVFFPDFSKAAGLAISPLLEMIPYVVTILVLIVTSIRNRKENQPPAALGLPYFREDR